MSRVASLFGFVLMLLGILAGCRMAGMQWVPGDAVAKTPEAGKALIVFTLPYAKDDRRIRAIMVDVTDDGYDLIGLMYQQTRIAHQVPSGKRRFMVVGKRAYFLDADLLPGRTYYVRVKIGTAFRAAQFALVPYHRDELAALKSPPDCPTCTWLVNTENSINWAARKKPDIEYRKSLDLPAWLARSDREVLRPQDHL